MTGAVRNIGSREIRKRRFMGVVGLVCGATLGFALVFGGASRWSRLVVFPPLWLGALGLLQAREKTCIAMAARGTCNLDRFEERVDDLAAMEALRRKARKIHRRALFTALAATLLALLIPDRKRGDGKMPLFRSRE